MPRKRRPDQGPPIPRIRTACAYCKAKRLKCSEDRPCNHCVAAGLGCVYVTPTKRRRKSPPEQINTGVKNGSLVSSIASTAADDLNAEFALTAETVILNAAELSTHASPSWQTLLDSPTDDQDSWLSFIESPMILSRPSTPIGSTLLDAHPQYRELCYHYTEVLCCLHSSHERSTNPVKKILSPVAQSSDSLLAVLLACSLKELSKPSWSASR